MQLLWGEPPAKTLSGSEGSKKDIPSVFNVRITPYGLRTDSDFV
jgi:hypothetical protein